MEFGTVRYNYIVQGFQVLLQLSKEKKRSKLKQTKRKVKLIKYFQILMINGRDCIIQTKEKLIRRLYKMISK